MPLIPVIRDHPPSYARCSARKCQRAIEWVRTLKGKRMPVDSPAPFVVETLLDETTRTSVDSRLVHWATCPEAASFSRKQRGGHA